MILETFAAGPFETNAYLVGCPSTKKAFVVDVPPKSFEALLKAIKKHHLSLETIFLTHSHWDHIADVKRLKEATGAQVFIHPLDAENLKKPGSDRLPLFEALEGVEPDGDLKDGDTVCVGPFCLQVIQTPGHTPGGVCLYMPKGKILFSGDTLFKDTMGRVDFPQSSPLKMWESLKKLACLPSDIRVFPGHGPATEIRQEVWWMVKAKERFGS